MSRSEDRISEIQQGFGRAFVGFLWLNVLLGVLAAWWRETLPVGLVLGAGVVFAGVPTLVWALRGAKGAAVIGSLGLAALVALLVGIFMPTGRGPALQIDMHMYFFACMAACVGWLDRRAVIAFAGFTTLHHLVLAYVLPLGVFPDGGGIERVLLHGLILTVEVVVLVWVMDRVRAAMRATEEALDAARIAHEEADRLRHSAEARGAVDKRWRERFEQRAGELRAGLATLAADVGHQVERMQHTAAQLSGVADGTVQEVGAAEEAAGKTATSVREMERAAEALTHSVAQISGKMHETTIITRRAAETARETNTRVLRLAESAQQIENVVKLIETVARQTNLLALNATIEAAKAGEAGRGFAVVASEVKALSAQTSQATGAISGLVAAIRAAAQEAVAAMDTIEQINGEVDRSASVIASSIAEQEVSTADIGRNSSVLAERSEIVVGAIGEVLKAAEQTAGAAFEVDEASRAVAMVIAELTGAVDLFLGDVLPEAAAV
ncbi:methyl-accepting chemotaxis protein [Chelatococcus sp. SYSU_G07232]|uniref:Methyl-accepting chemotaxis protein n=1 Tax=Chelatococcus albus TaxID=3047466 RepID=A0ABT7AHZ3_9HYPH|nr:methyl-accepting chemotaxis protein [Chelatococcus sp. SYSU_G07232]MDJ1158999.1 methyl-accepting chemotaxis protein [Chelatococcus sp. SYSU_G07232]